MKTPTRIARDELDKVRHAIAGMSSHYEGLADKAEAAYQAGNIEAYDAYSRCADYTEERILLLWEKADRLLNRAQPSIE